jgi:hypothetical protein
MVGILLVARDRRGDLLLVVVRELEVEVERLDQLLVHPSSVRATCPDHRRTSPTRSVGRSGCGTTMFV